MTADAEILEAGGARLAAMLRAKQVSAEEIMRAHLDRIAAANGPVNAIVGPRDPEACLEEARAADATLAASAAGGADLPPLHGLPIAIKDLAPAKDLPFTRGSPLYADEIAPADGPMPARLRRAGAIFVGKTNTPEFGLGSHTINPVWGPCRNPWNHDLSAGGSSGGAAVALACRMLPIADGSDMMGSLRNPAGWNNVFGFRPSWGLCPNDASEDLYLHQLSTDGPMGRSVADLALLLDCMSGYTQAAPLSHGAGGFAPALETRDPRGWAEGLRIGWLGDWDGAWAMEAGVMETVESALKVFEDLGATVTPLRPGFSREALWRSWIDLRSWAVAGKSLPDYEDETRRAGLKPEAVWEIERGMKLSALDIHAAGVIRGSWHRRLEAIFQEVDLIALPSAQLWPFPVETRWPDEIAGVAMDTYHRWMECVVPASLSGRPAISVPAGFGPKGCRGEGLPMGLQLIGPARGDLDVLRAAAAFEAEADWARKAPPGL